jgi:hypothetical protein
LGAYVLSSCLSAFGFRQEEGSPPARRKAFPSTTLT